MCVLYVYTYVYIYIYIERERERILDIWRFDPSQPISLSGEIPPDEGRAPEFLDLGILTA